MDLFPGARAETPARPDELLPPRFLARLESLQLVVRRRLAGAYAGEHRSTRHGSSPDFADYRDYHPGDDFRRIDYNLYARLGTLLVKLFEATDELTVRLLVDTSGSMSTKLTQAARVAAALGFVALCSGDPVVLHTVPAGRGAPRFSGRRSAPAFFKALKSLQATGPTPLGETALRLVSRPGPQGLTVVVSDLLTPEWESALRRLPARGGGLAVLHVLDPADLKPEALGDVDLVDREDGSRVQVSLSPVTAARFTREAEAWADSVAARTRRAGGTYLRVMTGDDIESLLMAAWRRAGLLR